MSSDWTVDGKKARNKNEYEAFLRDHLKIKKIKEKIDLNDKRQLERLYSSICTGSIRFESSIGFDFEDEITRAYEIHDLDKKHNEIKIKEKEIKKNKRFSKDNIKENGRLEEYDDQDDMLYSDYIKSVKKVEDSEENVDKELVEYYLEKQRNKKKIIKFAIIAVAFAVIVISVFMITIKLISDNKSESVKKELEEASKDNAFVFTTIKPSYQTQVTLDTYETPDVLKEYEDLYNKNTDLIGWITISDTNIDYPVVKGDDNEYYLNHNFNNKSDANGSIFVDMNCSVFPRSKNLILYGHHMKSGKMFANLEKYDSYDFYVNHKTFKFDTIYEKAEYEVVFVFRDYVHASDATDFKYYEFVDVNSEVEFNSYIKELKQKSIYNSNVELTMEDELLTLSTCDYLQANGRFVVMAKKIK